MNTIQEKREALKKLSLELQPVCKKYDINVNTAIRDHIMKAKPGITAFETFEGWKRKGYTVKKGEKAHILWGRQVTKSEEETEPRKFFPIVHLFDNLQVEPLNF